MDKLLIKGGQPLHGKVDVAGAKNAVLPLMAACLLTDEPICFSAMPHLQDVTSFIQLLAGLGVDITLNEDMSVCFDASALSSTSASAEIVKTMRASILVLGPLLAKNGVATVALPGGCTIGARPVNIHLEGLEAMGAKIEIADGFVHAKADRLKGCRFEMHPVTVTGTENLLMAAALAEGETVLVNAACEPEVVDLAECLIKMGAKITGHGTPEIRIQGVEALQGCNHRVMPDRIEAGTYLVAAAMTGGCVRAQGITAAPFEAVLEKLREAGVKITEGEDWIEADARGVKLKPVDIETAPYPDFPTDMQAQFLAMNVIAEGESEVVETIFENRYMHVPELAKMGANIQVDGNHAHIKGVRHLKGAKINATDLRASACLVLAGLVAEGETLIDKVYHIDRGYERIEEKFSKLGANILRLHA
jgi:UDP-N-acetylglucosamine 1-carboxyvinyltransferase